ncbi:MAG TPA: hypothetical protein VFQ05_16835 [Candidatus Eisenbacteria bacterium]|nr:hypothetical protein [Candidatus Eisenbacteria bacterium]
MKRSIRLTLGALLLLTLGTLVLGTLRPSVPGSQTPYLSKLSDVAVKPAYAVPCNRSVCVPAQGNHYKCEYTGSNVHCILSSDRRDCTTLTNLVCEQ